MIKPIRVTLSPPELLMACIYGSMRKIYTIKSNIPDSNPKPPEREWQCHLEGCFGEAAFAKYKNIYWNATVGQCDQRDVGDYEVRYTIKDNHRLYLLPSDKDDHFYVLITGRAPNFTIRGGIYGRDGKQQKYWQDPGTGRPCYFIPQQDLIEIPDL